MSCEWWQLLLGECPTGLSWAQGLRGHLAPYLGDKAPPTPSHPWAPAPGL